MTKRPARARTKLEAKARAAKVLKVSRLKDRDSTTTGLRKLDKAMTKMFGKDYDTKLSPLGITLSEKPPKFDLPTSGTGTVRCTFPPWHCRGDVDF